MNFHEIESQITALLLNELSNEEAAAVRQAISENPDLAQLQERIAKTIALVREASSSRAAEEIPPVAPMHLSEDRRKQLRAAFKTVAPNPFTEPRHRELHWMVPMSVAAVLVVMIGVAALLPGFWGVRHPELAELKPTALRREGIEAEREAREVNHYSRGASKVERPLEPSNQPATVQIPDEQKPKVAFDDIVLPKEQAPSSTPMIPAGPSSLAFDKSGGRMGEEIDSKESKVGQTMESGDVERPSDGLAENTRALDRDKVPALGDTPTLGVFFKSSVESDSPKKDLPDLRLKDELPATVGRLEEPAKLQNLNQPQPGIEAPGGSQPTVPTNAFVRNYAFFAPTLTGRLEAKSEPLEGKGAMSFPQDDFIGGLFRGEQIIGKGVSNEMKELGAANSHVDQPQELETAQSVAGTTLGLIPAQKPIQTSPEIALGEAIPNAGVAAPISEPSKNENGFLFEYALNETSNPSRDASRGSVLDFYANQPAGLFPGEPRFDGPSDLSPASTASPGKGKKVALLSEENIPQKKNDAEEALHGQRAEETFAKARDAASSYKLFNKTDSALGIDLSKSRDVEIMTRAQGARDNTSTAWQRFKEGLSGSFGRTAQIQIAKEERDITPLLFGAQAQDSFDPYFVQTESEKIKSKTVLYKVIEKLDLNKAWAQAHGAHARLSTPDTYQLLVNHVDVQAVPNSNIVNIQVHDANSEDAARIANTIAEVYREVKEEVRKDEADQDAKREAERARLESNLRSGAHASPKLAENAQSPQPEIETRDNPYSTFSLNVSDVSFKLAAASLEKGVMPAADTIRSEEFINAFDYHDPEPASGVPVAFTWDRAQDPFAQNRDIVRLSIKTAAMGRHQGYPLNLVLLLDRSGSMERADRVKIVREALHVLAKQLQPLDRISVITFARTAKLWADGVTGDKANEVLDQVGEQIPEGGTNLEEALNLAYQTALKHYVRSGGNRVVLLTDGAANLGNVDSEVLQKKVELNRRQGVALDCFGIGWEGFNDNLLEVLSSHGDGRYGFLNSTEDADSGFAGQLAGALKIAAADVKVQVEFNPKRVTRYRQIGYGKHQLTKEQFRDNSVDAAELGAAEQGNALYVIQVNSQGTGELGQVRVRYKDIATGEYREHEWPLSFSGNAPALEQSNASMRLAATAGAFSEWLTSSPNSSEVTPDRLLGYLRGVLEVYGADPGPKKLEWMIRQAKSISGH